MSEEQKQNGQPYTCHTVSIYFCQACTIGSLTINMNAAQQLTKDDFNEISKDLDLDFN